jgi:hypothetical protein
MPSVSTTTTSGPIAPSIAKHRCRSSKL